MARRNPFRAANWQDDHIAGDGYSPVLLKRGKLKNKSQRVVGTWTPDIDAKGRRGFLMRCCHCKEVVLVHKGKGKFWIGKDGQVSPCVTHNCADGGPGSSWEGMHMFVLAQGFEDVRWDKLEQAKNPFGDVHERRRRK